MLFSFPSYSLTVIVYIQSTNILYQHRIIISHRPSQKLTVEPNGSRLTPRTISQLRSMTYTEIDPTYQSINPISSTPTDDGSPYFFESESYLRQRCQKTLEGILQHANGKNICIVSHTPCSQAMSLYLENAPTLAESRLGPWPLGGITHFSREEGESEWKLEMYADTEHMPGEYRGGLKAWSLPCLGG